ncbi:MAG: hypothetical protein NTU79_22910 [Planctomycetota bacterium]|nr:hypothetical protein [Planctomycetota bacterium]
MINTGLLLIALLCITTNCFFSPLKSTAAEPDAPTRSILIVVGAPGEEEYAKSFPEWAERWKTVCTSNTSKVEWIDGTKPSETNGKSDHDRILDWISENPKAKEHWIVLIGHGTSDRDATKFNLRGPDISAEELAKAIGNQDSRWVIINCASSSGPFINALSGKNRVVITATKSGSEQNYARFGDYISQSISDPEADLDHDFSVSILEAFLAASNRVAQFYANEERLASEQALLDDNGDAKGTPAVFYRGARPIRAPAEGLQVDGLLAGRIIISTTAQPDRLTDNQRIQIDNLETQVEGLRNRKKEMPEDDYYQEIEKLFLQIASIRGLR